MGRYKCGCDCVDRVHKSAFDFPTLWEEALMCGVPEIGGAWACYVREDVDDLGVGGPAVSIERVSRERPTEGELILLSPEDAVKLGESIMALGSELGARKK